MTTAGPTLPDYKDEEKWLFENLAGKDGVKQVNKVKGKCATSVGENYASEIIRMKAEVMLDSGQKQEKSYIIKKQTANLWRNFETEFRMYTEVLPRMEKQMRAKDPHAEPMWCKLICWNDDKSILVLEDLKAQGYLVPHRLVGMDLYDCLLTVRELGRYHALTASLINNGEINPQAFNKSEFRESEHITRNINTSGLKCLVKTMKEDWDQNEWEEVISKIEALIPEVCDRLFKVYDDQLKSNTLKVLSHGDCWTSNLMVKYSSLDGTPMHVKFLDFQLSHINTPAWDLTYFLYTSCKPGLRRENWSQLFQTYYNSLTENLRKYGFPSSKIPTMAHIEQDLRRLDLWAFLLVSTFLPGTMAPPDQVFSIEPMLDSTKEYTNFNLYKTPKYVFYVQEDIKNFSKNRAF